MTPSFRARLWSASLGYAVTRIVGIGHRASMRYLWSSTPVIPGIWTSATRQSVLGRRRDPRKSVADANTSTVYPSDRRSSLREFSKGLIVVDDRYQSPFRIAACSQIFRPRHSGTIVPRPINNSVNVSDGSRQSNAGAPKRWLMSAAVRLAERAVHVAGVSVSWNRVAEEGAPFNLRPEGCVTRTPAS